MRGSWRWLLCLLAAPVLAQADPSTLATEVAAGRHPGMHAMLLMQHDRMLASARTDALPPGGMDIRSATKSVTALLVGIALDRGLIPSLDTRVIDLLPELAPHFSDPRRARMRLRDLLTMRSGLDCDDWTPGSPGHEDTMYEQRDWLAFWAAVPLRDEPGTRFSYCTGNVVALGRILAHATGQSVPDFAQEALFAPLGITRARWATWNDGRDTDTGGHLEIPPQDMLRLGQLVLAGGQWQGRQLVSAAYVQDMITAHTDIPDRPQQYGYLWWLDHTRRDDLPRTRLLMAWGNGGNFIVVMPELDAVYVTAGERYNQPDALAPLHWLRDRVLPALGTTAPDRD
ncbi:serine hydrolase domain-containing protein [Arenimonas daejeonensis]|uniref:serine hydrolase domain-containing protein n=1 Tax=Arenimonas daejeonensis TaxID=370777 RepID=UPI0013157671|nr:serine hydrolase [Arenimonas daejeonensis]